MLAWCDNIPTKFFVAKRHVPCLSIWTFRRTKHEQEKRETMLHKRWRNSTQALRIRCRTSVAQSPKITHARHLICRRHLCYPYNKKIENRCCSARLQHLFFVCCRIPGGQHFGLGGITNGQQIPERSAGSAGKLSENDAADRTASVRNTVSW